MPGIPAAHPGKLGFHSAATGLKPFQGHTALESYTDHL
jgi:hypothetical protein